MESILTIAAFVTAFAAAAVVLYKTMRWLGRKVVATYQKGDQAFDVLVGRPEILHPETGQVLVPATPGLGMRLATMEHAIVSLSHVHRDVTELTERVEEVAETLDTHITESAENNRLRMQEQKAMWDAVQAVAKATPPAPPII